MRFYEAVFGWKMKRTGEQMGNYVLATTAMNKVTSAGGQVLGEPMDIPGVGAYVSFVDTEGNRASLLQPLPMAASKPKAKAKPKAGTAKRVAAKKRKAKK